MHPNAVLIARFYDAFNRLDADGMIACYSPDVTFEDPAFGVLRGDEAGSMWRMLTDNSQGLEITTRDLVADDTAGSVHWTAKYTFSTGRPVVNEIDARFTFENGLIKTHVDRFDMWRWSRQALGTSGLLLGWLPFFHAKVQRTARGRLDTHRSK